MDLRAALAEHFANRTDIRFAMLFGSAARDQAGSDSDLDIAVLGTHRLDADERMTLVGELASLTGRPVDLVDLYDRPMPLLRSVLLHGVPVHRPDPAAHGELLSRMLADTEDFLPYRDRILEQRRRRWTGE